MFRDIMLRYEFIIVFFEAYIYISFLRFFIEKEISRKWLVFMYAVFMAGMICYRLCESNTILFFALNIGSIAAFTIFFGVNYKKALMLGMFVGLASFVSRELTNVFIGITYNQTIFDIGRHTGLYLTSSMVSKLILFMILRIVIRKFSDHDRTLQKRQWLITMCVPLLSMIAVHFIKTVTEQFRTEDGYYSLIFLSWLAIINMVTFVLYDGFAKQSKISLDTEHENTRLVAENSRYDKMIAYVDNVHSFMHDIQGHLKTVLSLTETDKPREAADYIRKMDIEVTEMYENSIMPQYPAVDTVLRQKTMEARIRGITLDCDITVPGGMPIIPIHLCIILGNALDNAIEACAKLASGTSISLKMFLTKNRLAINIVNPSGPVEIDGNKIETTKDNPSKHGYGMRNIESIIEKYKGNMLIRYDEGYFCMIMLILF